MDYADTLRCIGQDLERRGLKAFDIRVEGKTFIVECGYQEPPAALPVSIQYDPKDIDDLDRSGEDRRGEMARAVEFLNPVQILRTIGAHLDRNELRLLRLTNNHDKGKESLFKVEYLTRDRERVVDDHTGSAIYDMCVQMYKQRGRLTGTGGRRASWRR